MKRRRLKSSVFSGIGILLLLCALILFVYNMRIGDQAEASAVLAAEQIEEYRDNTPGFLMEDLPEVTIDGITYIGTIRIESLGLELPVISELTDDLLNIAPCRYTGSVLTDDMVIAGHNYRRHFGQLRRLEVGTEITFVDMNEKEYSYVVASNEVLQPSQIDEMIESEYDLTLFTCTNSGQARFALRCEKIE